MEITHNIAKATNKTIKWHRAFIASNCDTARIPGDDWNSVMTKDEAQAWLWDAVNKSINARGNFAPLQSRDEDYNVKRDYYLLKDISKRIRVYQFNSRICSKRFAHLLSKHSEV